MGWTLRPSQLKKLRKLCLEHNLDTELIDNSLTYAENVQELGLDHSLDLIVIEKIPTLRQQRYFDGLYEKYDFDVPLHQRYGISDEELSTLETPFIVFQVYYRIPYSWYHRLKHRLKPYNPFITWINKWYFVIRGTFEDIQEIKQRIPPFIKPLKSFKEWERNVIFAGHRWVRLPELPIPLKIQH